MRTLFPFLAALFSIPFPAVMSAEKPFSFKETPGRLPKDVVPTDYSIRIIPELDKLIFPGTEKAKRSVGGPVHQLVLNALELKIGAASIDGKELPASAIKIANENEL